MLADSLAPHADPLFSAVENGYTPSFLEAWGATLSYCFQIYFDFSGYTDMALGLALLFGIRLPANFNAPYKATGYIEFWRRWHITLSHFLRDYLYIPLGGNKNGSLRKYQNLVVTMLIGGLWHGANWNFVIWGGVHGILIAIKHGLRRYFVLSSGVWALSGWFFTFLSVSLLWVLFRAESFVGASVIYSAMFNLGDITLPSNVWNIIPAYAQSVFSSLGMQPGSLQYFKTVPLFTVLLSAALISFLFPNTPSLFRLEVPEKDQSLIGNKWRFIPNARWALLCAAMFILSVSLLQRESPFLYFQF